MGQLGKPTAAHKQASWWSLHPFNALGGRWLPPSSHRVAHVSLPDGVPSTQLGKPGAYSVSLFPVGEITGQEGFSWHFSEPPWGRGDVDEGRGSPVLLNASSIGCFPSRSVLELLC